MSRMDHGSQGAAPGISRGLDPSGNPKEVAVDADGNLLTSESQANPSFVTGAKSAIILSSGAVQIIIGDTPASDGVLVKAANTNSENVYIGAVVSMTTDTSDATDGFELGPGESNRVPVDNANKVFVRGTSATPQRVSWEAS